MLIFFWSQSVTPPTPPAADTTRRIVFGMGPHPKHVVHPHPVFNTKH